MEEKGTIILGIKFSIPKKEELRKWDYNIIKEKKTTTKVVWLEHYVYESYCNVHLEYHKLAVTNRGRAELDDKPLKGQDSINANYIMEQIGI